MCRIDERPDPIQRTIFIDELTTWHPNVTGLAAYGQLHSDHALRSGLCLVMGSIPLERLTAAEIDAWSPVLAEGLQSAPDSVTHSAAGWALRKWNSDLPAASEVCLPSRHRQWFVNSLGLTLVAIEPGEFMRKDIDLGNLILAAQASGQDAALAEQLTPKAEHVKLTRDFFLSDREITVGQFQKFISDADYPNEEKPQQWPGAAANDSPTADHPVQMVNWLDAALFCNWLSRREGLTPCYERTGKKEKVRAILCARRWRSTNAGWCPAGPVTGCQRKPSGSTRAAPGRPRTLPVEPMLSCCESTPSMLQNLRRGPPPAAASCQTVGGCSTCTAMSSNGARTGSSAYAGGDVTNPVRTGLDPDRARVARGGSSWVRYNLRG